MFKHLIRRYLSLALVLALVLAASIGTVQTAVASGENGLEKAIAAQEKHTDALMSIDGVIGTAVGLGDGDGHVVLVLTTSAGVRGLPRSVDGVLVRPLVTGEINALARKCNSPPCGGGGGGKKNEVDRTARFDRPVPIGVSTGHPAITAGTIGARVVDGSGNVYALSNNHVYADVNAAGIGDAVIQPGTFDGGSSPADDIGTLFDFGFIDFTAGAINEIDAAIALTTTGNLGNATPSDGYGTPKSVTRIPAVNEKVMKYGRTTGQTKGIVAGINATVNVNYGAPGVATFVHQIIIQPGTFSAGGDSGSLIVSNERGSKKRRPVGLLFAGSSSYTIANPIDAVLNAFGVTIDGE